MTNHLIFNKALSLAIFAAFIFVLGFSNITRPILVSAQTPESSCPNPGTSQYTSCIVDIENKLAACNSTFVTGTSDWQQCREDAYKDTVITPGSAVGQTSESFNTDEDAFDRDANFNADCSANDSDGNPIPLNQENCGIIAWLVIGINILSALAGVVIVASIMIAGYTYMTARDNAGQIMKAKMRIVWTLAALVLFVFMYALLNFLIPGGVL